VNEWARNPREGDDFFADALYYRLFEEAESVRWRMSDIPWQAVERDAVTPGLLSLVRQAAHSELTTYSATLNFLKEFADDVDFTQWIAVWFYEETKHPHALMQWLAQFGESVEHNAMRKSRATAPFMKSRVGTLVTNIISEVVASHNYLQLHKGVREPVLAQIARLLAADEARHSSGFYTYARRALERSAHPDRDRADALKVLYMWFRDSDRVAHPVNEFHSRARDDASTRETADQLQIDPAGARKHAFRIVGSLVGCTIDDAESITTHLSKLSG
jgi:hypothetical protein